MEENSTAITVDFDLLEYRWRRLEEEKNKLIKVN